MIAVRVTALAFVAVLVQTTLLADLRVFGVAADAVLLVAVLSGLLAGSRHGAIAGFVAGLSLDLLVTTPLGLTALSYCLAGYLAGRIGLESPRRRQVMVASAATSAAGITMYAFVGMTIGIDAMFSARLLTVALTVGVLNGLLSVLFRRPVGWSLDPAMAG